jgi:hypothetical protein
MLERILLSNANKILAQQFKYRPAKASLRFNRCAGWYSIPVTAIHLSIFWQIELAFQWAVFPNPSKFPQVVYN